MVVVYRKRFLARLWLATNSTKMVLIGGFSIILFKSNTELCAKHRITLSGRMSRRPIPTKFIVALFVIPAPFVAPKYAT
jgi:hypothetical protein